MPRIRLPQFFAASAFVALLCGCGGGGRGEALPGVSFLGHDPKPFFEGNTHMNIRFTTTGPPESGRWYQVYLDVPVRDKFGRPCHRERVSAGLPIAGEAGVTYSEGIGSPDFGDEWTQFCPGVAHLIIMQVGGDPPARVMKTHTFRIFREH